jgi:DNA-binding GntR family transcriptional regulator
MVATGNNPHGTLRSHVYQRLRENILRGFYPRGEALTELRISRELGVSRTPIREAFCQLELDGLVTTTPNKGVVVQGFDQQDILDLYDVRCLMESLAAAKAAENMTLAQRQSLQKVYDQEQAIVENDDHDALILSDAEFHDQIFRGSGSKILQNILTPISTYTRQSRIFSLTTEGRSQAVVAEHGQILAAILGRDSARARTSMNEHIIHASDNYRKLISGTGGPL